jgi:hypothetical protein
MRMQQIKESNPVIINPDLVTQTEDELLEENLKNYEIENEQKTEKSSEDFFNSLYENNPYKIVVEPKSIALAPEYNTYIKPENSIVLFFKSIYRRGKMLLTLLINISYYLIVVILSVSIVIIICLGIIVSNPEYRKILHNTFPQIENL